MTLEKIDIFSKINSISKKSIKYSSTHGNPGSIPGLLYIIAYFICWCTIFIGRVNLFFKITNFIPHTKQVHLSIIILSGHIWQGRWYVKGRACHGQPKSSCKFQCYPYIYVVALEWLEQTFSIWRIQHVRKMKQ